MEAIIKSKTCPIFVRDACYFHEFIARREPVAMQRSFELIYPKEAKHIGNSVRLAMDNEAR
jgi:hypothetical protein